MDSPNIPQDEEEGGNSPNIPQDEEKGGKLLTMSRTEIKELVQGEVVASLLNQDWLKDEKIISHLSAALDEKISNRLSSVEETIEGNLNILRSVEETIEGNLNMVEEKIDKKIEDQGLDTRQLRSEMDNLISASLNPPLSNSLPPTTHHNNRSITNLFNRSSSDNMPYDTFSLMMITTLRNKSWWFSFGIFVFQMALCIIIAVNQIKQGNDSSIFNVPFHVEPEVRVGQLMSIIFCVAIQTDVHVSFQTLGLFWKTTRWDKAILERDDDTDPLGTSQWLLRILLPNLLRLVEGILGIFVSFVVIVQSNNIIDLLRDFTALMIVSELDNLGFRLAAEGYIGKELHLEALRVKEISNRPSSLASSPHENQKCNSYTFRQLILATMLSCMIGTWLWIVIEQVRGEIFYQRFPDCMEVIPEFAKKHFGNGKCYGGNMNTLGCEFEGGDCINFNLEFPLCRGDDLVDVEVELANDACNMAFATEACGFDNGTCCSSEYTDNVTFGDGVCDFDKDSGANIKECGYENGDCLEYNDMYCSDKNGCCPLAVVNGTKFANGICNGGHSATSKCRFDGTDCNNLNNVYLSCPFDHLAAVIDGSDNVILGDKVCDSGVYSTEECGWEFGDCAVGQIGQDLLDFGGITAATTGNNFLAMNTKMSADGNTLAVGMPHGMSPFVSLGRVQLFHYHSRKRIWMRLDMDMDLVGDSNGDSFGYSIAMSRNGTRLAVAAPRSHSIDGIFSGQVKVFDINSLTNQSSLTQVGQSIYGESEIEQAGANIDISADGSKLIIAAPFNDKGGTFAGQIRLYDLQNKSIPSNRHPKEWVQVAEILGQEHNSIGLYSLSLSISDGSVVMFSAGSNSNTASSTTRIYALATTGTDSKIAATQIGDDISSPYIPYGFERALHTSAMSGDGNRIVIASNVGNPNEQGSVQVFDYDDKNNTYYPVGGDIVSYHGPGIANDSFGYSVALSIDGNMLAISSVKPGCDGNDEFCATGAIEVYAYDPISNIFRAPVPKSNYSGRDNIIREENEVRRESSVFGIQLSIGENVDNDGLSTSSWLSVQSYNFETEKEYVEVYNLSEQFYPKCGVEDPSLIGNGECDSSRPYNTEECGWDGGDCDLYNSLVDCTVDSPGNVGNGKCRDDPPYNTEECGWDGGDCDLYNSLVDCIVDDPEKIGNEICDDVSTMYNTEECGWDGGDCDLLNSLFD